jgi:hypothetical protein
MNLIVQRIMPAAAALSVSFLIAACGARSINSSNETFTVYEDAPKMSLLDLGQPGNSPGDVYHFSAPLHSSAGGQIRGDVFGSKTLIKLASDAAPDVEKRGTLLVFYLWRWSGPNCRFWDYFQVIGSSRSKLSRTVPHWRDCRFDAARKRAELSRLRISSFRTHLVYSLVIRHLRGMLRIGLTLA